MPDLGLISIYLGGPTYAVSRRDGEKAEYGGVSRTLVFYSCFRPQNILILTEFRFNLFLEYLVYFKWWLFELLTSTLFYDLI